MSIFFLCLNLSLSSAECMDCVSTLLHSLSQIGHKHEMVMLQAGGWFIFLAVTLKSPLVQVSVALNPIWFSLNFNLIFSLSSISSSSLNHGLVTCTGRGQWSFSSPYLHCLYLLHLSYISFHCPEKKEWRKVGSCLLLTSIFMVFKYFMYQGHKALASLRCKSRLFKRSYRSSSFLPFL